MRLCLLVLDANPKRVVDAGGYTTAVMGDAVDARGEVDLDIGYLAGESDGVVARGKGVIEVVSDTQDASDICGQGEVDYVAYYRLALADAIE